jgi:steroid delta-isomerase-like uncharacterized protein
MEEIMKGSIRLIKKIALIFALALLCFVFGCQQKSSEVITDEEVQILNERIAGIWNDGRLEFVEEIYTPEVVRHDCGLPEDVVGLENMKNYFIFNRTAFPDLNLTVDKTIVKGHDIVFIWTFAGTNTGPMGDIPPTGKSVRFSGISAGRLVDGKLAEVWDYYNQASMLQQLGFTLTPPALPEEPEEG